MIQIQGKPSFLVTVNRVLLGGLEKCAQRHYDHRCKSIAGDRGLLWRWELMIKFEDEETVPASVVVEEAWRDFDLLLKVCEIVPAVEHLLSSEEVAELRRFRSLGERALMRANDLYDKWKERVE